MIVVPSLLVPRSQPPELLELVDQAFDPVALPVECSIDWADAPAWLQAAAARWAREEGWKRDL
jgi:hypothetical protein